MTSSDSPSVPAGAAEAFAHVVIACHGTDLHRFNDAAKAFVDCYPPEDAVNAYGSLVCALANVAGSLVDVEGLLVLGGDGGPVDPDALPDEALPTICAARMVTAVVRGDSPVDHLVALESRGDPEWAIASTLHALASLLHPVLVERAERIADGLDVAEPSAPWMAR